MAINQISVFIENRTGSAMEITGVLAAAGVNMRALCIADTADYGVVRVIADKTDEAVAALKEHGFAVTLTDVIAVSVSDEPGGFHAALEVLYKGGVSLEYAYAFVAPVGGGATVILRCSDQEEAVRQLTNRGLRLLEQADVSL